ncbi:expressed unknown protein [Seminavis robusta]|uniref:Uncharacterized protein n=1 Tax=Seminavis robusta TaxID=568900 RepID=A0A9N8HJ15_9STRA|nr:expressed unknown protein [Seminavis robusta]|eukprot:Sro661_g183270.1 n/a (280) ;mRNA; f:47918-48757
MLVYGAMEGIKCRKAATAQTMTKDAVYNPFAHRTTSVCPKDAPYDDPLDASDSSLNLENMNDCCSSTKKSAATTVKILSLVLVGFAAGLLYHLVIASQSTTAPVSSLTEVMEEHEFLTDDLIKKLASANQFQEQEIAALKELLVQQEADRRLEQERIRQEQHEEEMARRRMEDNERQERWRRQQIQRRRDQQVRDERQRHHDALGVYVPPMEQPRGMDAEQQYQQHYHEQFPQPAKKIFDMTNPQVAQAKIVGHIDQESGQFVRHERTNLRGNNNPPQS